MRLGETEQRRRIHHNQIELAAHLIQKLRCGLDKHIGAAP